MHVQIFKKISWIWFESGHKTTDNINMTAVIIETYEYSTSNIW